MPDKTPQYFTIPVGLGSGTSVISPKNPILPNGAVNFIFQIRGISQGDIKTVGQAGINAIVITAEAGGMGSSENLKAFGSAQFVNNAVAKIINYLKTKFPGSNPKVGNVALSSWSGGYGAVGKILSEKSQLAFPITAVTVFDGIHEKDPKTLKPWIDYAKEAEKDPSKKFVIVHTNIVPPGYASTTDSSNSILNNVGLKRNKDGKTQSGGFAVYDIGGDDAKAHIAARDSLKDVWQKYLAPQWNQGTIKPTDAPDIKTKPVVSTPKPIVQPSVSQPKKLPKSDVKKIQYYFRDALKDLSILDED